MTDIAAPGPLPPPPPRSGHGCLWGCLIAGLIAIVAVVGAFSYLGWYFNNGFKDDATLKLVVATVNADPFARSVLGDDIAVTTVSSATVSTVAGSGTTASYIVHLKGSKAEGTLEATVVTHDNVSHVTSLVLTGPSGRRYDLNAPPQIPNNAI
ncbi:MAG: cytochrome c oxidase assembly factor Coa1 family protein [Rhizomicrobium sp.]